MGRHAPKLDKYLYEKNEPGAWSIGTDGSVFRTPLLGPGLTVWSTFRRMVKFTLEHDVISFSWLVLSM